MNKYAREARKNLQLSFAGLKPDFIALIKLIFGVIFLREEINLNDNYVQQNCNAGVFCFHKHGKYTKLNKQRIYNICSLHICIRIWYIIYVLHILVS